MNASKFLQKYNRIVIWGMGSSLAPVLELLGKLDIESSVYCVVKKSDKGSLYQGHPITAGLSRWETVFRKVLIINCASPKNKEKAERNIRRERCDFLDADALISAFPADRPEGDTEKLAALEAGIVAERQQRPARSFLLRDWNRLMARNRRRYPIEPIESNYNDYWIMRKADNVFSISPSSRYRANVLVNQIEKDSTILDIGCGDGTFIKEVEKSRPDVECHGIDLSDIAVEIARSRGVKAERRDIVSEPLESVYDYITMMCVLEHVVDAEEILAAFKGKFRKGLYIAIPNLGYIEHRLGLALLGRTPVTTIVYHMKEHVRFWTYSDFVYWADMNGYRVKRHFGLFGGIRAFGFHRWLPRITAANILYELEEKSK